MTAPDERAFTTFLRGWVRDNIILESYRNDLRQLINPQTNQLFAEDEIQRATAPGSRFYIDADSIDLFGQASQSRALNLSDQVDPRRSNDAVLKGQHGEMWLGENSELPAVGASGLILAKGTAGSTYVGSTTLGSPTASLAVDVNGVKYQCLIGGTIPAGEDSIQLPMQAILTDAQPDGANTNRIIGDVLTWSNNQPTGTEPEAAVIDQGGNVGFTGGFNAESSQAYAERIEERIRAHPASGNPAHFQSWAKQASVATEQAFIYPCAFQAGSVLIAATQKRNLSANPPQGPLARVPSVGLLVTLTGFLTAPGSPVVPQRVFSLVTPPTMQLANQIERLTMSQGVAGGWFNVEPWPNPPDADELTEQVRITTLADQLNFTVTTVSLLPGQTPGVPLLLTGTDAPSIMVWNVAISRFEELLVASIDHDGVNTATVILTQAPSFTLVDDTAPDDGTRVSPFTDRLDVVATAIEEYFDGLGPGEVVAESDPRFVRAARQPRPNVAYPLRAGQAVTAVLIDALGGVTSDAELTFISQSVPDLPANINDGPNQIGLGNVNLYPLN